MGTNYYVYGIAAKVRNGKHGKHFGKRSAGWDFALHVYPDEGIERLEDWLYLLSDKNVEIRDEYGRKIKLKQLLRIILFTETVHRPPKPVQSGDYRYAIFPTYF